MALPINIESLINGNTIESARIEFKAGYNPNKILHTLCAFANDFEDWGSGYLIIGIEESNGKPILPAKGLEKEEVEKIQKEIPKIGHHIQPNYFPTSEPYLLDGKLILILYCPVGEERIYTAPKSIEKMGQEDKNRVPYIRIASNTTEAKETQLKQLRELAPTIPFDERICRRAELNDMDLALIQAHLQEVKSNLFEESKTIPFADLCKAMKIAKGSLEDIKPINAGLLVFSREPEKFFSRAWIELVWHKDESSRNFTEHYFKGPIQKQLREALSFIQTNIITEKIIKHPDKAEADRFYNYPFQALEEALANAIYHKSYEIGEPIEIQIFTDKITILSKPAAIPPVTQKNLMTNETSLPANIATA